MSHYKIEEGSEDMIPKNGIKMKFQPPVTKESQQKAFTKEQFNQY